MGTKGEHVKANSNTMLEIAELMFKEGVDIDVELDILFNNHSQLLTSKYMTDVIDDGPGGKTSTAEFNRIKFLKPKDVSSMISSSGQSFQEVLVDRELTSIQKQIVKQSATNIESSIN